MSLMSTLQTDARVFITEIADTNALSNANLAKLLNYGAREFIRLTDAYPTAALFNATVDTAQYLLSAQITNYGKPHKDGLWWEDSSNNWHQLDPETRVSLSRKAPAWLDASSGSPMRYFIEGNDLWVNPPPETTDTNAFQLFMYARSVDVTVGSESTNYIFTNSATLELKYLIEYEPILFDYVRSVILQQQGARASADDELNKFYLKCEDAKGRLAYRADLLQQYRPYRAGWPMMNARANVRTRR